MPRGEVLDVVDLTEERRRFFGPVREKGPRADHPRPLRPLHDLRDEGVLDMQDVGGFGPQAADEAEGERGLLEGVRRPEAEPPRDAAREPAEDSRGPRGFALEARDDVLERPRGGAAALI